MVARFIGNVLGPRAMALALAMVAGLALPAHGLEPGRSLDEYGFDAWSFREGFPATSVNDIVQTPDGYLWLGTYDGLVRFDGVRFTPFTTRTTPGLGSDGIRDLDVAPDGGLWVATNGGGVSLCENGLCRRFGPDEVLPDPLIWAIHAGADGGVWAGSSTGALYRREPRGGPFVRQARPGSRPVGALLETRDGGLWVGSYGDGIERRDVQGRWTRFGTPEGLPSDTIGALAQDSKAAVWASTSGGVARVAGSHVDTFPLEPAVPAWSVHVDRHDVVWVGGTGGHLFRIRDGRVDVVPRSLGLPEGVLPVIAEDNEGNLWLGTDGFGLLRLRDVSIVTHGRTAGLPANVVYAVAEASDGSLLVGTAAGLGRLSGGRGTILRATAQPVRSVASGDDGTIWVGLDGGGVGRLRGGAWQVFTTADGLGSNSVRSVVVGRDGTVWAATLDGLSRHRDGRWTTLREPQGLPGSVVLALLDGADGEIWGGTEGAGLFRIHDDRIERLATDALRGAVVLGLARAREGSIWVGTNRGLARVDRAGAVRWLGADPTSLGSPGQVAEDEDGVWACGSAGLVFIAHADVDKGLSGAGPLVSRTFGAADGLGSRKCTIPAHSSSWRARDGRLHFATYGGVSTVYPDRLDSERRPPQVHVEQTLADGRPFTGAAGPGVRRLDVSYTGISLRHPDGVRFRHRLHGFDPDWIDAGGERATVYTNLRPGDYRFEVQAAHGNGPWSSAGDAAAFTLRPHFWQTRAFAIAAGIAAFALAFAAYRVRVRQLHVRQRELEATVGARTRDLQAAALRAERADAFKTRMLEIAAHDLKNPLTIMLGSAQLLPVLDEEPRTELARGIERSSLRMLRLIDDLLLAAALEGGRLELTLRTVDLAELVGTVVEESRVAASRKQQSISVDAFPGVLVRGDEDRLRQVLENLLGNALKFSPAGAEVNVSAAAVGDRARLAVSDHGPGLDPEDRARLFQPFARLSARPTAGEPTTGLGLSIVRQLVELHGGTVTAESEGPGRGTTFLVDLPRV